jgi:hypothetical protein
VTLFSTFRNTALAAVAAGLALSSPARADWLVDDTDTFNGYHVEFITPTFETSALVSTFILNVGSVSQLNYNLATGGTCAIGPNSIQYSSNGCTLAIASGAPKFDFAILTSNPDVYDLAAGGTMTFTQVAAVLEPASLPLLALGLAGLGIALRTRRT